MKIAVVGLGLIGGSFCRSIKKNTCHVCLGIDTDKNVVNKALREGAIDKGINPELLGEADLTIVCLHPQRTVDFLRENVGFFKKNSIVMDACGIKGEVVRQAACVLLEMGVYFIPAHPMAGTENSGFDYSYAELFTGASLIVTPSPEVPQDSLNIVKELSQAMGFGQFVISTPEEHDRIIAFTSQLAHIVSSCYIKSPTARYQAGFSAGSFKDMTRVAKLNEDMWTDLFMMNRQILMFEIESIIENLKSYDDVLRNGDKEGLRMLLRNGRLLKEESLRSQGRIAGERMV